MIKAVIFDVDGVIVDSMRSNALYYQDILETFGYPRPSMRKVMKLFHLSFKDTIRRLLPNEKDEKIVKICKGSRKIYPKYIKNLKLTPGIKDVLEKLSKKYKLAIVSSRRKMTMNMVLERFKIKKYFKTVIGFEDYKHPKPHPEPLRKALKKLKTKPGEAVYIGDTLADFESARNAGTKVIIYSRKLRNIGSRVDSLKKIIPLIDLMARE